MKCIYNIEAKLHMGMYKQGESDRHPPPFPPTTCVFLHKQHFCHKLGFRL